MKGMAGALWKEAVGGNEVLQQAEGKTLGEPEVGLQLMTTEGGVRSEVLIEEGFDLGIRRQRATRFQDMLKAGATVDFAQQLRIGMEDDSPHAKIGSTAAASRLLDISFHLRREGADAFKMHGKAFRQQLWHRVSQINEDAETGTGTIGIAAATHRLRQRTVIDSLQINGAQMLRCRLTILARRILMDIVFEGHGLFR